MEFVGLSVGEGEIGILLLMKSGVCNVFTRFVIVRVTGGCRGLTLVLIVCWFGLLVLLNV